jgi:trehalose 6-phosphate phosphatase
VSDGGDRSRGVLPDGVLEALDRLASSPPLLVVTDFDGTLSPIVPDPPAARILPAARRALRRLAAIAGREGSPLALAVLSGREAADVARRVAVAGPRYLGQHGIEEARLPRHGPGIAPIELAMDPWLAARGRQLEAAAAKVAEALGQPDWLVLERKGASVGLHYRRAPDPDRARASLLAAVGDVLQADPAGGAQVMESRRVVELRPDAAHGKGQTTARLIRATGPGAVLVLGDDRTDAEAFDAVREWREATGRPALIVGVSGAGETPAEIVAGADVLLADPAAAAELLGRLADVFELRRMPAGR